MSKKRTRSGVETGPAREPGRAIHIGTSGWHYRHWRGCYYPQDLAAPEWLTWYAREFDCVEVNRSFYRLPAPDTVARWCARTPPGFVFALKASRLITHLKKLQGCAAPLRTFLGLAGRFGPRLGPILFQLPPRWRVNPGRLADFLALLPSEHRYAFEFRDPSWHDETVYRLLRQHRVAFCQFDLAGRQTPEVVTADLIYIRLHGPGAAYCGSYSDAALQVWAERIRVWAAAGCDVFVFFDNDQAGYAVADARRLSRCVQTLGG